MSDLFRTARLFAGTLPLSFTDLGRGRTFLLLHGGAGPASLIGVATALANDHNRVVLPTHPGFNGAFRPEWFSSVADLVAAYLSLIDHLELSDVMVVGHSFGGWIAAELALRNSPRMTAAVLMNAVGIDTGSEDKVIVNPMDLEPAERVKLAFHNKAFAVAPSTPEAMVMMRSNYETLKAYADRPFMFDPAFRQRLAGMTKPVLVAWGESDGIVDLAYGRRYADSVPGSIFKPVAEAGHNPHIEKPDVVLGLINEFLDGVARDGA
ncbi:pimeloyl-ACP methyl ester carboxylesterase [Rhizobium sp. BK251]|nr:pimeloyl-ACP methyl ester carboxylesterase [Rhizobium sp. BK251]